MNETVNQEPVTTAAGEQQEPRTFTQAEVNSIVADRLTRERAKDAEYDDLKTKAQQFDTTKAELDALNKELAKKGGALIGVNTFTLDGDEAAISEAKDVLAKKGVTYQNVYFASDGEAGKFTTNIFAYPTTYVVDRNGNIVGDPIVGAITEKKQAETLQKLIDQALAADMG